MSRPEKATDLRRRARKRLRESPPAAAPHKKDADLTRLLHELRVHQVELELQNEARSRTKEALEASSVRYAELYDFAPVGYFTFDRAGLIREANLRGATLLGVERSGLTGRRFGLFVVPEARSAIADFLTKVFAGRGPECCDVLLATCTDGPLHIRVEAVVSASGSEFLAAVIGISETKHTETPVQRAQQVERARTADLAAVLDAVPAIVWIAHDAEAQHISGNQRADELLGLLRGADAPLTSPTERPQIFTVFDKEGRELQGHELPVQRAASGTAVSQFEEVVRFEDGTERHLFGNAVPLRDDEGRPRGAVSGFVDITNCKQAETALQQQAAALAVAHDQAETAKRRPEAVMEALPVGVAITDAEGASAQTNSAFEKIWGGPHPTVRSVDDHVCYRAWWAETERSVLPEEWASARAVRAGEAVVGSPVAIQDITALHRAEAAVRQSESQLRLFFDHAPAALAMFDREMCYPYASRRWVSDYGLGDQDLRRRSVYAVFPEIPESWREVHRRALAGEVIQSGAEKFERPDGTAQWVRWEVRPWRDGHGAVG